MHTAQSTTNWLLCLIRRCLPTLLAALQPLLGISYDCSSFMCTDGTASVRQVSLDAEDIRNEKVKVLRSMKTVTLDDVVIGQYRSRAVGGKTLPGYLDDKTVPKGRCVFGQDCHEGWAAELGIARMQQDLRGSRELFQGPQQGCEGVAGTTMTRMLCHKYLGLER